MIGIRVIILMVILLLEITYLLASKESIGRRASKKEPKEKAVVVVTHICHGQRLPNRYVQLFITFSTKKNFVILPPHGPMNHSLVDGHDCEGCVVDFLMRHVSLGNCLGARESVFYLCIFRGLLIKAMCAE